MENKRFFAFGCSFTKYAWPTWADILGRQYTEYYNYGRYGAGNMYIFNALMEADQYHKLTKDDLVIVQWSCSSREDRYKDNQWVTPGGVANYYSHKEFKKFFDFRGFVIRDIGLIKAAKHFLENVGCEYYFTAMVPFITNNMYGDSDTNDVAEVYKDVLSTVKLSYESVLGTYGARRPKDVYGVKVNDSHPVPSEHYRYIQAVLPDLLKQPKSIADNYDKELAMVWETNYNGWTYSWPDIEKGITHIKKRL